jgi:hypothetical protein
MEATGFAGGDSLGKVVLLFGYCSFCDGNDLASYPKLIQRLQMPPKWQSVVFPFALGKNFS